MRPSTPVAAIAANSVEVASQWASPSSADARASRPETEVSLDQCFHAPYPQTSMRILDLLAELVRLHGVLQRSRQAACQPLSSMHNDHRNIARVKVIGARDRVRHQLLEHLARRAGLPVTHQQPRELAARACPILELEAVSGLDLHARVRAAPE